MDTSDLCAHELMCQEARNIDNYIYTVIANHVICS